MKRKQITAMITTMTMVLGITACGAGNVSAEQENKEQTEIESILNISNNNSDYLQKARKYGHFTGYKN